MSVGDNVYSAIETIVTKTSPLYRYIEIILKTILNCTGVLSWGHEDVFTRESIPWFAIAMTTNKAFLGAKRVYLFLFENLNLNSLAIYRIGYPVAWTPLQAKSDKKLYLDSLEALGFGKMVMEYLIATMLITVFQFST